MGSGRARVVFIAVSSVVVLVAIGIVLIFVLPRGPKPGARGPVATIEVSPSSDVTIDTAVRFSASGSTLGISENQLEETRYTWDFGDGAQIVGESVTHKYEAPGDYVVTLSMEVFERSGKFHRDIETLAVTVVPPKLGELVPVIAFDRERTWTGGEPIEFDGGGSWFRGAPSDSLEYRWEYEWSFGDGSPEIRGEQVSHRFGAPGDFEVELEVIVADQFGREQRATYAEVVHIHNRSPEVVAKVHPTGNDDRIEKERAVILDTSESYDPDGGELFYAWDVDGDGFIDVQRMTEAQFRYEPGFPESGEYTAMAYVWDEYMLRTDQSPEVKLVHVTVGRGSLPLPFEFGSFLVSGGLLAMGELRLWNAAAGMQFSEGQFLAFAGYAANTDSVLLDMTNKFPEVQRAGYTVTAEITTANVFSLSGYYSVRPQLYVGGSLGYLTYKGTYNASCRVSIGGKLPPVAFSENKIMVGFGIGYLVGFGVISLQVVFAL